jgi:hypothetical protein
VCVIGGSVRPTAHGVLLACQALSRVNVTDFAILIERLANKNERKNVSKMMNEEKMK